MSVFSCILDHLGSLLHILESTNIGSHIGPFFFGAPTCADDVMLIGDSSTELQSLLDTVSIYSRKERYHINPSKTTISIYPGRPRAIRNNPTSSWTLGDATIEPTTSFTHLGLDRFVGKLAPNELIDARLELARRSRYALMGVGLHGVNGLSPSIAVNIYNVYIMPRYTYNLDVSTLTKSQVDKLEMFHRKTLRSIQGLPDRTSSGGGVMVFGIWDLRG